MTEQPSSQSGQASSEQAIDPAIVEAVQTVANRFGVVGLEELITEARRELGDARAALEQLEDLGPGAP